MNLASLGARQGVVARSARCRGVKNDGGWPVHVTSASYSNFFNVLGQHHRAAPRRHPDSALPPDCTTNAHAPSHAFFPSATTCKPTVPLPTTCPTLRPPARTCNSLFVVPSALLVRHSFFSAPSPWLLLHLPRLRRETMPTRHEQTAAVTGKCCCRSLLPACTSTCIFDSLGRCLRSIPRSPLDNLVAITAALIPAL